MILPGDAERRTMEDVYLLTAGGLIGVSTHLENASVKKCESFLKD